VCCISTKTVILPENITCSPLQQIHGNHARILQAEPSPAEYDLGYDDTRRFHSQTRKLQLEASHSVRSVGATQFELQVSRRQLTPEMYASSVQLRAWCKRNSDRCYIPEWLLKEWVITVDPSSAA
jgi:hypothetical protein